MKVINKSSRDLPLEFKLENSSGTLRVMSPGQFIIPKEKLAQTSILIELDSKQLTGPATKLVIGVYSEGKRLETVKTAFVGPR